MQPAHRGHEADGAGERRASPFAEVGARPDDGRRACTVSGSLRRKAYAAQPRARPQNAAAMNRCGWAGSDDPLMLATTTRSGASRRATSGTLFEMLTLEGAQAGLSWTTILRKREGYRARVRRLRARARRRVRRSDDVARLLADAGIVRNRAKIEATIGNARAALALREAGGTLVDHLWSFVGGRPRRRTAGDAAARSRPRRRIATR